MTQKNERETAQAAPARKRVALVGFASSYKQAPFKDETVEIWGLNELWRYLPRWTRWFEMHPRAVFGSEGDRGQAAHVAWMQTQDPSKPIYMIQPQPDIPGSVAYPLADMAARFFPGEPIPYFTSTISYMLALAIAEGFTEISLYGIDLAADKEYAFERPAAEYLIGVARGRGITVTIAAGSALLKTDRLYGYDQRANEASYPLSLKWLEARVAQITATRDKTIALLNTQDGQLDECIYMMRLAQQNARGVQPDMVAS